MAVIAASLEHARLADPEHHVRKSGLTEIKKNHCCDITIAEQHRVFHLILTGIRVKC